MFNVHWIEVEFYRRSLDSDLPEGVDLNLNGEIEGDERTDLDGDGLISAKEWGTFLDANETTLAGIYNTPFKSYYEAGRGFGPDNPLNDLLAIERKLEDPRNIAKAYRKAEEILNIVKTRIRTVEADFGVNLRPEEKLGFVYDAMVESGLAFEEQIDCSLTGNIVNGKVDCDTSSFLVLAVAHEMGWPVHLVGLSGHYFVRWDDGEYTRFNMDMGYLRDDEFYISLFDVSQEAIDGGVYMKSLDYRELLSSMYENRGTNEYLAGIPEAAIEDFSIAVFLNPKHATAYNNLGLAKSKLWKHREALEDLEKAVNLDPNNVTFLNNRGTQHLMLGRYFDAVIDFNAAIDINPDFSPPYYNRAVAMSEIEKLGMGLEKIVRVPETLKKAQAAAKAETEKIVETDESEACSCSTPGRAERSSPLSLFLKSFLKG